MLFINILFFFLGFFFLVGGKECHICQCLEFTSGFDFRGLLPALCTGIIPVDNLGCHRLNWGQLSANKTCTLPTVLSLWLLINPILICKYVAGMKPLLKMIQMNNKYCLGWVCGWAMVESQISNSLNSFPDYLLYL